MMLEIRGKRVNYDMKGKGRPVLFVHGWGGTINSLKPLHLLASKKYQAVILDLPGFGRSDNPGPDWGVGEYSQFLINFLNQLGIVKTNYFGHSFGGSLGIFLAANHSNLIDKLILCNSTFKRQVKISDNTQKLKRVGERLSFLKPIEPLIKKLYYRIFFPESDLIKFPKLETNFKKIMTQDLSSQLEKIDKETLILWGKDDQYTPVDLAYELKNKIKNSRLKIFPNIGHNLPLKCPNIIYQEVRKFI